MKKTFNPKIILFNGPPGSGKDTAAQFLNSHLNLAARMMKFATPIKECIPHLFNDERSVDFFDRNKDKAFSELFGLTPRQVMIAISEDFMKPLFGEDVWTRIAINRIVAGRSIYKHVIFSDCGFNIEVETLAEEFGKKNLLVIRMIRKGKDYKRDSRQDVVVKGVRTLLVRNDKGFEELQDEVISAFKSW